MYQEKNKKQLNICFGSNIIPSTLKEIFDEEFNSIITYSQKSALKDFIKSSHIDIVLFNKDQSPNLYEELIKLRKSYPDLLIFICAETFTPDDLVQCIDLKIDGRLLNNYKKEILKEIVLLRSIKYLQQQKHIRKYLEKQSVLSKKKRSFFSTKRKTY